MISAFQFPSVVLRARVDGAEQVGFGDAGVDVEHRGGFPAAEDLQGLAVDASL